MDEESPTPQVPDQASSLEYIQKLESRLSLLESHVRKLELKHNWENNDLHSSRDSLDEPVDETQQIRQEFPHEGTQPKLPPVVPKVQIMPSLFAFRNHVLPSDSRPVVEALFFSPDRLEIQKRDEDFKRSLARVSADKALDMIRHEHSQSAPEWKQPGISVLRVNSVPLIELLLRIQGMKDDFPDVLITFVTPFESPIHYHEKVEQRLADLESQIMHETTEKLPGNTSLIEELRCYVDIMDEIVARASSISSLTASDNAKVSFWDLWHVFKPGVTIYYPDATTQPNVADYAKVKRSKNPTQKLWRVYSRTFDDEPSKLWIKAYYIDHNGDSYVCVKEWFSISKYEDPVSLTSLKVYPVALACNGQSLMKESTENGKRFQSLITSKGKLCTHNGWAWEPDEANPMLRYINGDLVVDFGEVLKARNGWKPSNEVPRKNYNGSSPLIGMGDDNQCFTLFWKDLQGLQNMPEKHGHFENKKIHQIEKIAYCEKQDSFLSAAMNNKLGGKYQVREEDCHLLPCRLFAYSLSDRRFVSVNIANVTSKKDHESDQDKFHNLVIHESYERMLRALVKSHFHSKNIQDSSGRDLTNQDIIHNKGRGLVILLHGVPGVGKTSTAETIAAEFKKPLLPITCGDLGLEPEEVERSLKEMFRLAQVWDCILLVDEADVFLAERMPSDLKRNALVSVFLRVLDYYSGILFLTTNRVGIIDEAFKSRIHISLYYPHLDEHQSKRIWEINLQRLKKIEEEQSALTSQPPLKIDESSILEFALDHHRESSRHGKTGKRAWNGRQIRNAFLIAAALARFERQSQSSTTSNPNDLTRKQFELVRKTGFGFERYLFEVKGQKDDSELAQLNGIRDDSIWSHDGKPRQKRSQGEQRHRQQPLNSSDFSHSAYLPSQREDARFEYARPPSPDHDSQFGRGNFSPPNYRQQPNTMSSGHYQDQYGQGASRNAGRGFRFGDDGTGGRHRDEYGSDFD